MPQLDKLSFMSQYLWLTIFFFVFYYFVLNFFVIFMFRSLTLRSLVNELYFFRMFKVNFDKGIISETDNIFSLLFILFYSVFFHNLVFHFKRSTFFFKNITYLDYFFDAKVEANTFISSLKFANYKNINNIII